MAAIAALPPEAFLDGPPQGGDLVWRRAAKQAREERSGRDPAPDTGHLAPVTPLHGG